MSYLREFSPQVSQIRLLQLYELSAQISQIVFSSSKTSKMSYISEFSVEVTQIVFSAHLTVLAYYNIMSKNFKTFTGSWIIKYHKSCS